MKSNVIDHMVKDLLKDKKETEGFVKFSPETENLLHLKWNWASLIKIFDFNK